MKLLTYLLSFGTLLSVGQGYSGDTWATAKSKGQGTISLAYVETPSFVYKDESGSLTGICVDIMTDFVKWAGKEKQVRLNALYAGDGSNFKGMYEKIKVSNGGAFGLGNITITEERKKEVKFSPPFISNFAILITGNSVPNLIKLEDMKTAFAKLTAYTAKGTLNEKRINDLKKKYHPEMKVVLTSTSQESYEKIIADPNGMTYLDLAFFLQAVAQKKPVKRHPVGDQTSEKFAFIMPMNSDWAPIMEEFFNANGGYTNSVQYKTILRKHLGETGVKLLQSAK